MNSSDGAGRFIVPRSGLDQFKCKLCNTEISGQECVTQHLEGKNHRRRVRIALVDTPVGTPAAPIVGTPVAPIVGAPTAGAPPVAVAPVASPVAKGAHDDTKADTLVLPRVPGGPVKAGTVRATGTASVVVDRFIQARYDDQARRVLWCTLCQTSVGETLTASAAHVRLFHV